MAIAAGVDKDPAYAAGFAQYGANFAVPALFLASFPSWFVGVAFAAIAIGALVPAAIMSIACANLFTRNLYKEFIRPDCSDADEARMAKIVSLVVKIGAVVFILAIPQAYAIQLQLLGGIWIIQLLPPLLLGLYTRGFNALALLLGWAAGTALGTYMAATQGFTSSVYPLEIFGVTVPGYAALYSVLINFLVVAALSPLLDLIARPRRGVGRALILAAPQPRGPRPPPHSSIGSGRDSLSSSIGRRLTHGRRQSRQQDIPGDRIGRHRARPRHRCLLYVRAQGRHGCEGRAADDRATRRDPRATG